MNNSCYSLSESDGHSKFADWPALLALFGLALGMRAWLVIATEVIARDSVIYLEMAQQLAMREWSAALAWDYPPGYPGLVALVQPLAGEWVLAGQLVSALLGSLGVVPLYLLARGMFGPQVAALAGLLYSFHPYLVRLSGEVLSDISYLCLFLTAAWLGWEAISRDRLALFSLVGLGAGLAYLIRPEGLGVLVGIGLLIIVKDIRGWRRNLVRRVAAGALLVSLLALPTVPYLLFMRAETGIWVVSKKKSVGRLLGLEEGPPVPRQEGANYGKGFLGKSLETFHPLLFLFLLLGLHRRIRRREVGTPELFLGVFLALYLFVLQRQLATYGYLSHRHFISLAALSLPLAALGIQEGAERAGGWFSRCKGASARSALPILAALILLVLAAKTVKPQRLEKLPVKEAGAWIAAQQWKDPVIMAEDARIAFYAQGRILPLSDALENKTAHEQLSIVRRLIGQATSQEAQFIFLNGSVDRETQKKILASAAVDRIMEWPNRYGDVYTLIQVKGSTK